MKSAFPNTISFLTSINTLTSSNTINYDEIIALHNELSIINEKVVNIWYRKSQINTYKNSNKILKVLNDDFCKHILNGVEQNYAHIRNNTMKVNNEQLLGRKRRNESEYDYDKEIYNDVDFYNFILKEFLLSNESDVDGSGVFGNDDGSNNRYDLTMKYLMNRQKKVKKNVDTKASKNRKIRYDKHEKIINFMVPQVNVEEANGRDLIVASLFGMKKKRKDDVANDNNDIIENDVDLI